MERKKRSILYLGNKLSKHGKTPTGIDFLVPKLKTLNFKVVAYSDKKNKLLRLLSMWGAIFAYRKSIDYILIDTYSTLNFWYAVSCAGIARKLSIPYICVLRGGDLPNRIINSKKTSESLFKKAYTNITLSEYLAEAFKKQGFTKITYIPNTIELSKYKFERKEFECPKLLWVRSFSEIYHPELAILIFGKLKQTYPKAELCMVGPDKDGSLEKCKQLAKKKNLPVRFTGKLAKEEWLHLAKDYNIFINTTNFDNTPISVIEAMALGLPVISTRVGGLPYLIENGVDGILVEKGKSNPFVGKITFLMENTAKAQQIAMNARKKVEKFDWEAVKEKWEAVLQ